METFGIVLASFGFVLALVGSGWNLACMYRQGRRNLWLPLLLLLIFPVAVAVGWNWSQAPWQGVGMIVTVFLLCAAFLPGMMSRVGWHYGMDRRAYQLNRVGLGLIIAGALLARELLR